MGHAFKAIDHSGNHALAAFLSTYHLVSISTTTVFDQPHLFELRAIDLIGVLLQSNGMASEKLGKEK